MQNALSKGHPSYRRSMFLILGRVCAGDIPAAQTAHLHGLSLPHIYAKVLIELVGQLHIPLFVAGVPLRGVVADFTSFDANQLARSWQDGIAHLRQSICQFGGEALLLRLDTPIVEAPQMDIQLVVTNADVPLLKSFAPAIRCLSRDVLLQGGKFFR